MSAFGSFQLCDEGKMRRLWLMGDGPGLSCGGGWCAGTGVPVQQLSPHWRNILTVFDTLLETLKNNNVPQFLVKKLFQQLFSFVNVQLFNQLLLRRECCSFNNGEYVKTGLAEVEAWIQDAGKDWVGESWDELRYIRQVGRAARTDIGMSAPCTC